jgi:hypothetical protein
MFDLLALGLLVLAFAGAVGYVRACDDLSRSETSPDKTP